MADPNPRPLIFTQALNQEANEDDIQFMSVIKKITDIAIDRLTHNRYAQHTFSTPEKIKVVFKQRKNRPIHERLQTQLALQQNQDALIAENSGRVLADINYKIMIYSALNELLEDNTFGQRSVDKIYMYLGLALGASKALDPDAPFFQSMANSLEPYISQTFRKLLQTHIHFLGVRSKQGFSGLDWYQNYIKNLEATANIRITKMGIPILSKAYVFQFNAWGQEQHTVVYPKVVKIINHYNVEIITFQGEIAASGPTFVKSLSLIIDTAEGIDEVMQPYLVKQDQVSGFLAKNSAYHDKYKELFALIVTTANKHPTMALEYQTLSDHSQQKLQELVKTLSDLLHDDPKHTQILSDFKARNQSASTVAKENGKLLESITLLGEEIFVYMRYEHVNLDADYRKLDGCLASLQDLLKQLQSEVRAAQSTSKQDTTVQLQQGVPVPVAPIDQKVKKKKARKKTKDKSQEKTGEHQEEEKQDKEQARLEAQRKKAAPAIAKINFENAMRMSRALTEKEIEARQENIKGYLSKADNKDLKALFEEFYTKQFGHELLQKIVSTLQGIMGNSIKLSYQSRHYTISIITETFEETAKAFVMEEGLFKPFIIEYARACFYRAGYTPDLFGISSDYRPENVLLEMNEENKEKTKTRSSLTKL